MASARKDKLGQAIKLMETAAPLSEPATVLCRNTQGKLPLADTVIFLTRLLFREPQPFEHTPGEEMQVGPLIMQHEGEHHYADSTTYYRPRYGPFRNR